MYCRRNESITKQQLIFDDNIELDYLFTVRIRIIIVVIPKKRK